MRLIALQVFVVSAVAIGLIACSERRSASPAQPTSKPADWTPIFDLPPTLSVRIFHPLKITQQVAVLRKGVDGSETVIYPTQPEGDDGDEESDSYYWSLGGVRKKLENGQIVSGYEEAFTFRFYVDGSYQFKLLHAQNKALITEKTVDVKITKITKKNRGERDSIETSDSLDFSLPPPDNMQIDPTKEYLPLENGIVLVLDPNTAIATKLDSSEIWKDVEVVRKVRVATVVGPKSKNYDGEKERWVEGKTELGTFVEYGIDRGPLPTRIPIDTNNGPQYVDGENVTDTSSRLVYGIPQPQ